MNVSKKILIYILVGFLSICSFTSVYCRSVYAIEWAGGALAFEEALKWALALMGITATAGMTDAYWDEYGDDFTEYAIENGATQTEVANWQLKLCEGILDKGSSVWTSFKSWAKSLVASGSSGDVGVPPVGCDITTAITYINENFNLSLTVPDSSLKCYGFIYENDPSNINARRVFIFTDNTPTINSTNLCNSERYHWLVFNRINNGVSENNTTGTSTISMSSNYYTISSNIVNNGTLTYNTLAFGSSSNSSFVVGDTVSSMLSNISNLLNVTLSSIPSDNNPVYAFAMCLNSSGNSNVYSIYFLSSQGTYSINNRNITCSNNFNLLWYQLNISQGSAYLINSYNSIENISISSTSNLYLFNIANISNISDYTEIGVSSGDVADENFQTLQGVDQENLDVISSLVPDEDASEVTIPMPGVGTSDNTASADAYDDIVDQINSGTISLEDGLSSIQEILKVIVYDEVTDEIVPPETDPDTGENKTKEDAIKENKNNMGFSLAGLENVFPFCIPWDIYAFMSLLVADPEAPVFEIPFPNVDDLEHPLTQEVDLSAWDDAMALVRLAEDFVFIIGLMFATRSLIGAGGGD